MTNIQPTIQNHRMRPMFPCPLCNRKRTDYVKLFRSCLNQLYGPFFFASYSDEKTYFIRPSGNIASGSSSSGIAMIFFTLSSSKAPTNTVPKFNEVACR